LKGPPKPPGAISSFPGQESQRSSVCSYAL
jgi:hypothetical protein